MLVICLVLVGIVMPLLQGNRLYVCFRGYQAFYWTVIYMKSIFVPFASVCLNLLLFAFQIVL